MNNIDWFSGWFIGAVCLGFLYNLLVFRFSSKILQGFTGNKFVIPLFAFIDAFVVIFFYLFDIPRTLLYISGTFLLFFQYLLISKATVRQSFFGAVVFFLHIATIHSVVVSVLSAALGVYPYAVFEYAQLFFQSLAISYVFLIFVLLLVEKWIPFDDIIKISTAHTYSKILALITFFLTCYVSIVTHLIVSENSYEQLAVIAIATTVFSTLIFYYFFLYSMNFVKMHVYKRKNEKIKDSHLKLITEKRKIEQEISKDGLTQLYTKSFIYDALETLCAIKEFGYAVLFIDINGLKFVNDTYGHESGDRYICRVAKSISSALREQDLAARIGGDEFFIILDEIPDYDVKKVIKRITQNVAIQNEIEEFAITVSIGSLYIDKDICEEGWKSIVARVDKIMLKEKQQFYEKEGDLYL